MNFIKKISILHIVVFAFVFTNCGSDQSASSDRLQMKKVAKAEYVATTDKIRFNDHFTEDGSHSKTTPHEAITAFEYLLPNGWKEADKAPFRDLNFSFTEESNASCYLTILPKQGGEVLPNLNRWRGQFGLAELNDSKDQPAESITCLGATALLYTLQGNFAQLGEKGKNFSALCVIQTDDQNAFSIKFTGPSAFIEKEKNNFIQLLGSLKKSHPVAEKQSTPPPMPSSFPEIPDTLHWDTPMGWELGEAKTHRVATFSPTNKKNLECYISALNGEVLENINRWRTQMALSTLTDIKEQSLQTFSSGIGPGVFVVLEGKYNGGMSGKSIEKAQMLGAIIPGSNKSVFVKMVGAKEEIDDEKNAFLQLVNSLRGAENGN